jgi:hypothetical protein
MRREVGKMFGRVPMMVMSHQYMLFDTIPELEAWSKEVGHKLPLAARCRQLLLPASGKDGLQPWPL